MGSVTPKGEEPMTKKWISSICLGLAMALVLTSAASAQIELVDNGGFETGDFTGWDEVFGVTAATSMVNPASGLWSANLDASSAGANDVFIKSSNRGIGQVSPGDPVTVSFDARGTLADGGVFFVELISEFAGKGGTSEILAGPFGIDPDPDTWTNFVFNTTAGGDVDGGLTLLLKSSCGATGTCVADMYFDNASMTIIPEPASAALLGLSGLALLFRKRRV